MCIIWKYGSTTWDKLSDFKECYPVETAEYATARDLDDEQAFNWWVNQILKKRDRVISLLKRRNTRYLKKTSKYEIELPNSKADAYLIDNRNGNTHWDKAIYKEMENTKIAFDIMPDGQSAPRGYTRISCHMIFDIKIEDFRRKERLVAGGQIT